MGYQESIEEIVRNAEISFDGGFRYIFLIGAGASVASNIKVGDAFLENLMKKHELKEEDLSGFDNINFTKWQKVMNLIKKKGGDALLVKIIREMVNQGRRPEPDNRWIINNCYNTMANILINKPEFSRVIFTTNYDPLINYAFIQNYHTEPIVIRHWKEISTMNPFKLIKEFPSLIYLHGYWQNHQLYLDITQIDNILSEWIGCLSNYPWNNFDVIVIGYSGKEDSIAKKWVKACIDQRKKVWWCLHSVSGTTSIQNRKERNLIKSNLGAAAYSDLIFIPIISAEQFALDLGEALELPTAIDRNCFNKIFSWFKPGDVSQFASGAKITYDTKQHSIEINFRMGKDPLPANNHAGVNIDTVEYELNIEKYKKIRIKYIYKGIRGKEDNYQFEFKLHSKKNAYSYMLPTNSNGDKTIDIKLSKFKDNGVALNSIWRVVIAADVNSLGIEGQGSLKIIDTELIS